MDQTNRMDQTNKVNKMNQTGNPDEHVMVWYAATCCYSSLPFIKSACYHCKTYMEYCHGNDKKTR